MTDIREHQRAPEQKARLLLIAQHCAQTSPERHDYLPSEKDDADKFQPHAWVLEAMELAFQLGRDAGRAQLQQSLRELIGARKW